MLYKKHLGQNFLKNDQIADQILEAAALENNDFVLEIGPGPGILTERLIKKVKEVWAVEKDFDLLEKLRKRIGSAKNLKLIHQDALWFSTHALEENYKIVANIPYSITSPLIRKFLENEPRPELMILMVQKEVAERICASPGNSNRGLLTLIVEYFSQAEILFEVNRKEFYPAPKVDSAVIKIRPKKEVELPKIEAALFLQVVKAGFSSKRRQIHNSFAATWHWPKEKVLSLLKNARISETMRAEDLSLDEWLRLAQEFTEQGKV